MIPQLLLTLASVNIEVKTFIILKYKECVTSLNIRGNDLL
jgi:hypothetical protein